MRHCWFLMLTRSRGGPNYLNFRFFLEDDFDTDSQYGIGISTNFTNLNSHGAELAFNVEMGTDKLIEAELYSPVLSSKNFLYRGEFPMAVRAETYL